MKKRIFKIFFALTLVTLLSFAIAMSASAEGEVLYEVTLESGEVVGITEEKSIADLIEMSPDSIKLYSDIQVNTIGTNKSNYVTKEIDIDLNGHTITSNGAYLRPSVNGKVTIHGGNIVHSSSYFAFVGDSGSFTVYDCEISAATNFIHVRNGSVTLRNCEVSNSVSTANFVQLSYAGANSDLLIDGCDFSEYKGRIVYVGRNSSSVKKTVTVKDTVIDSPKSVLYFDDQDGAVGSVEVIFTGSTSISSSLVQTDPKISTTTYTFSSGVKVSEIPSVNNAKVSFSDSSESFGTNPDSDAAKYPYKVIKTDVFYKLVDENGQEINVSEKKSFSELLSDYGTIKSITLYTDIEVNAVGTSKANYVPSDLDINLNGKRITSNGGYIYPQNGAKISIHDGYISHSSSYFAFVSLNCSLTVTSCEITSGAIPFHLRNGKATFVNTEFNSDTASTNGIFQLSYAGATTELEISGCTFNVKQTIINVGRNSSSVKKTVAVKDTVVNTTGSLLSFNDQTDATGDISFTFSGATKLSFGSFITASPSIDTTEFIFDLGVMASAVPAVSNGKITYLNGADGFVSSGDSTYPFITADNDPKYVIEKSDGTPINVYQITPLNELAKLCDSGSKITLYADVDITAEIAASYSSNIVLEIDLNGYTLTNTGARLRFYGDSTVKIYGGKIVDTAAKQFFFTGNSEDDKNLDITFEDCEILASATFVQLRNGSLTFKDCYIKTDNVSLLIAVSTEGYTSHLTFDACEIALGSGNLVSISRSPKSESHTVTVNSSTVTTSGNLFSFSDSETNPEAKTEINITGSSALKFKFFENNTNTNEKTKINIALGVKMSQPATLAVGTLSFTNGAEGLVECDDGDYKYIVSDKVPISVNPKFSLTLYTDFTLNLGFLPEDHANVVSVKLGGEELDYFLSNGMYFYQIDGISPIEIAEKQQIELTFLNYGMPLTKILSYSVLDYVSALLGSGYSNESKQMVCRALDYSVSVFEYVGREIPAQLSELMANTKYTAIGNSEWVSEVPASATDEGDLFRFIDSARMVIDSDIRFRFYLKSGIGDGQITYKAKTAEGSLTVSDSLVNGNNYFEINMRALDLYDGAITISFKGYSGSYDFRAYANSEEIVSSADEKLSSLIASMYNYFREANEYVKVKDKDFKSNASVVVKDGKAGTVTYILDDGDPATGEYTKVFLRDYENLKLTYGLIAEKYATLTTVYNEETGKYEYLLDENGNYVYTVNESNSELWHELVAEFGERVEYASHTYSHDYPGHNDEGGTVTYVTNTGELKTVTLPVGSATAEVYASIQILSEIFGVDVKTIVEAGVPAMEGDKVIDGVLYPGYYGYYTELLLKAYEEGLIIGARGGGVGGVNNLSSYVVTHDMLTSLGQRLDVHAYSLRHTQTPESWRQYIDYATESGGWSVIMMHRVYSDDTTDKENVIHLKESQMRYIFSYTDRDDIWVANYTEAAKYYTEWSTASVNVNNVDGKTLIVTVTDKENNEVFDEALTVKVTVPQSWTVCLIDGVETEVNISESGESYVYVNAVPDSGSVTITVK